MNLKEAREEFVGAWGKLGSDWGISRTMAQIHALLLVSPEPLDTDRVIEELAISRGNANTNLRGLIDWGLVKKTHRPGVRREFFEAEKDLWEVSRRIVEQRRRRELDPMMQVAQDLLDVRAAVGEDEVEVRAFKRMMREISDLGKKAGRLLDLVLFVERAKFFKRLVKLMPR